MKTASDPRHIKRESRVKALFSLSFNTPSISDDIQPILDHLETIDEQVQKAAPEWPLTKINKIDLAILRVAVYELTYDTATPPKVVIDEAVEIAKRYGAENSPSFVNGVLGTILKNKEA